MGQFHQLPRPTAGHKFGSAAPGPCSTPAAPKLSNPTVPQPRRHAARIKKVGRTFSDVESIVFNIWKTAIAQKLQPLVGHQVATAPATLWHCTSFRNPSALPIHFQQGSNVWSVVRWCKPIGCLDRPSRGEILTSGRPVYPPQPRNPRSPATLATPATLWHCNKHSQPRSTAV